MAIYAQFDKDGECLQLASNTGWSEFGDWVETLSGCPRISKLWEQGECDEIAELRSEMEEAIQDYPPPSKDVEDVAHQVIHAIDAGGKAEVLLITGGVSTG